MSAMIRCIAILAITVAVAAAATASVNLRNSLPFVTPELAAAVNSQATTWTASHEQGTFFKGATRDQVRRLLGVKHVPGTKRLPLRTYPLTTEGLPENFDSATNWPHCATITQIRDQSACGSCWAFGAAEAISDRYCTYNAKPVNLSISAADLLACCDSCGDGCNGGEPDAAWAYWVSNGLADNTCDPYPFPKCEHHTKGGQYPPCPEAEYNTPQCNQTCTDGSNKNTHQGSRSYSIQGEAAYMHELVNHGPFEVAFTVYEDFPTYKSGVYHHVTGAALGGHAVRLVGYGVLNGTKYWKIANSWNQDWGDHGYFLIRRGNDECGIEDGGSAGQP